jgi:hypothetical protein
VVSQFFAGGWMHDLLTTRHSKKIFFFVAALVVLILGLLGFSILPRLLGLEVPKPRPTIVMIVQTLFYSSIASTVLAALILWLRPPIVQGPTTSILQPNEIRRALLESAQRCSEYWFRGRSGRSLRATILPIVAAGAKDTMSTAIVRIQLPDPLDVSICKVYSEYRNAISDEKWTPERIRNEVLATIVYAASLKANDFPVDVEISLLKYFSLLRIDLSSRAAIVTREDPTQPGWRADAGTFLYNAWREDIRLAAQFGRNLPRPEGIRLSEINRERVTAFLQQVGLFGSDLRAEALDDIVKLVKERRDPYA